MKIAILASLGCRRFVWMVDFISWWCCALRWLWCLLENSDGASDMLLVFERSSSLWWVLLRNCLCTESFHHQVALHFLSVLRRATANWFATCSYQCRLRSAAIYHLIACLFCSESVTYCCSEISTSPIFASKSYFENTHCSEFIVNSNSFPLRSYLVHRQPTSHPWTAVCSSLSRAIRHLLCHDWDVFSSLSFLRTSASYSAYKTSTSAGCSIMILLFLYYKLSSYFNSSCFYSIYPIPAATQIGHFKSQGLSNLALLDSLVPVVLLVPFERHLWTSGTYLFSECCVDSVLIWCCWF